MSRIRPHRPPPVAPVAAKGPEVFHLCRSCGMGLGTHHTGLCQLDGGMYSWGPVHAQDTVRVEGRRAANQARGHVRATELARAFGVPA